MSIYLLGHLAGSTGGQNCAIERKRVCAECFMLFENAIESSIEPYENMMQPEISKADMQKS